MKTKKQKVDKKFIAARFTNGTHQYFEGDSLTIIEHSESYLIYCKGDILLAHVLKRDLNAIFYYTPSPAKK